MEKKETKKRSRLYFPLPAARDFFTLQRAASGAISSQAQSFSSGSSLFAAIQKPGKIRPL